MDSYNSLRLFLFLICLRPAESLSGKLDLSKDSVGELLLRAGSLLVGQKYEPEDATPAHYKEFALNDTSNDDILTATTQEIILRSGYNYENHQVLAADGYITTLVRIINPLVERSQLKWPPVMLVNGGIVDQKVWIWCSAIQHHPEKAPRSPADGPISSSNRSIGFTLANNGYDVWLVGTRGSNAQNQAHLRFKNRASFLEPESSKNPSRTKSRSGSVGGQRAAQLEKSGREDVDRDLLDRIQYWDYSMDEKAQFELPGQIDKVLKLTGSPNVSLVIQSLSSAYGLMMLAEQPAYSAKVHSTVVMLPVINNRGTNRLVAFGQRLFRLLPSKLGTVLITEILLPLVRVFVRATGERPQLRYLFVKLLDVAIAGPSSKYATLLEPSVYGNIFLPNSFKELKHYSQIVTAARLQKFDYGPVKNNKLYGTLEARPYDVSKLDLGNWLAISCEHDALAPPNSAEQFIRLSRTPPIEHIKLKNRNHLGGIAGFDIDQTVSLPILSFMDRFHLAGAHGQDSSSAARAMKEASEASGNLGAHLSLETPDIGFILAGHAQRNSMPPSLRAEREHADAPATIARRRIPSSLADLS